MNNRFFEKSSQELTTKSRNCSITYERKNKYKKKKMTKKQFFEKALRILRILNTLMALINWIF